MNANFAKLTLVSLVAAASMSVSAMAGDWNYGDGGYKGGLRGAAVPVPAPVPIPEYTASWYFRGDIGLGFGNSPKVEESGLTYGLNDSPGTPTTGPVPFGYGGNEFLSAFLNKDFDTSSTYGVGVGYYWSPRFRTDVTVDMRSQVQANLNGSYRYNAHDYVTNPGFYSATVPTVQVDGTVADQTMLRSGVVLLNAYYDIGQYGSFKPYVGLGLGFSYNEIERQNRTTESVCTLGTGACTQRAYGNSSKDQSVTLAVATMVGLTYDISKSTKVDLNYRYLYTGAVEGNLEVNGRNSSVRFGDQSEHQIRAGLRWDLN